MYQLNLHKLSEEFSAKLLLENMSISQAADAIDTLDLRLLQNLGDNKGVPDIRLDTFLAICNWLDKHPADFIEETNSLSLAVGDLVKIDFIDDGELILAQHWTARIRVVSICQDDNGVERSEKYYLDCRDLWLYTYGSDRDGNILNGSNKMALSDIENVDYAFLYIDRDNQTKITVWVDDEDNPDRTGFVRISKL